MGTLKNQPKRPTYSVTEDALKSTIQMLKQTAKQTKLPIDQVIKVYEIATTNRQIDAAIYDGDVKDEQLAGFAEYLDRIAEEGLGVVVSKSDQD